MSAALRARIKRLLWLHDEGAKSMEAQPFLDAMDAAMESLRAALIDEAAEPREEGLREALVAALRRSVLRHGDDREARWIAVGGDGLTADEVMADALLVTLRESRP